MPHQENVTLPAGMKKTDVWKLMTSDLDSQSLAKSSFMKIWKNYFSNVTIVKENPFSKCHICTTLHFEYEQCGRYDKEGKKLMIDKKREHWEYETEGGILHEKRGDMFVSEALPDDNH